MDIQTVISNVLKNYNLGNLSIDELSTESFYITIEYLNQYRYRVESDHIPEKLYNYQNEKDKKLKSAVWKELTEDEKVKKYLANKTDNENQNWSDFCWFRECYLFFKNSGDLVNQNKIKDKMNEYQREHMSKSN